MVHAPVRVILEEIVEKGRKTFLHLKVVQKTKKKEKGQRPLLHLMVVQEAKKKEKG